MKSTLYLLLLLSILWSGCNTFLDENPDPTKRVPTTLEDINMLANYSRNNGELGYDGGADEFFIPQFRASFSEGGREFYKTWTVGEITPWGWNYELTNTHYTAIQNCNASLDLLNGIEVTDANRQLYNKIKGKCHYLRASNYMFLAWTYCKAYDPETAAANLGMPIDEDTYFGTNLKRSTLKELYEYIVKEATLAYELLEVHYPQRGELNKVNAMGLLARIHLSMRQYDQALLYANELLSHRADLMDYNNPAEVSLNSTTVFKNHNIEMLEIPSIGARVLYDPIISTNANEFFIDTNLIASYAPDDLRLPAYFKKSGNYYRYGGAFYGQSAPSYPNHIMMVDEFYLVRAECYARAGNKEDAMKDVNDLLITRFRTGTFVPYTAATAEDALDIVLSERRKTLVLRGLRWMDIKRLNLEGRNISVVRKVDGVTYTLPPNDPRFARPLHSMLVLDYGYQQNPY